MRVLVTGGAGFIGANLCHMLSSDERVTEIVAYDNLSTGFHQNLAGSRAQLVEADLLDVEQLEASAAGCHSIVHLAARGSVPKSIEDPVASHHANATGTLHVLEAARRAGVNHVIVASSSSVYGANPQLPKTESLKPSPLSPYAASKLATEAYALAHQASFGLRVLAFRFFNVFGPLQTAGHAYAAVVPAFVHAAITDEPLRIHGDGEQSRDFTFVNDVCGILSQTLIDQVAHDEPVNLAFGGRVTLLELVDLLEKALDRSLPREHGPERPGDVRHSQADQTRLRSLFPLMKPTSVARGLEETLAWFQSGCGPLSPV
ncbi:MAG TPA: NAD-dependent epimerase/dehydratase family protein [Acidimicrobiales bacterium]|nr:NAD-dependent epimerase/dehydratase family protein [Acidimicrobiales bacterium]